MRNTQTASGRIIRDHAVEVVLADGLAPSMVSITGSVSMADTIPSAILAGVQTGTTIAAGLNNGVSQVCSEVIVQNQPINAINVLVGNQSLQAFHLTPDASLVIAIDNVNKIYIKTPSGSSVISWMAS